jgi:chemotaxis protein methyltransferase CheR
VTPEALSFGAATSVPELTRKDFDRIRDLAHAKFGLDLRDGKERLVSARLARHVRGGGFRSFSDYVDHVVQDRTGESLINLINALSTNHTSFFRESRHFDFMDSRILPEHAGGDLRIWSAACSSGEEPYSIVMSILEKPRHLHPRTFAVLASDVSTKVLNFARTGCYSKDRLDSVPPLLRSKYFEKTAEQQCRVVASLRNAIEFRRVNLMDRFDGVNRFDLIFCRNVMIYFNRATQADLVHRLGALLSPGGYLFVGHSESLSGIEHGLEYIEPAIYRKGRNGELKGGPR